jgi:hypothetical protein
MRIWNDMDRLFGERHFRATCDFGATLWSDFGATLDRLRGRGEFGANLERQRGVQKGFGVPEFPTWGARARARARARISIASRTFTVCAVAQLL